MKLLTNSVILAGTFTSNTY